jgi:hypothetical protein
MPPTPTTPDITDLTLCELLATILGSSASIAGRVGPVSASARRSTAESAGNSLFGLASKLARHLPIEADRASSFPPPNNALVGVHIGLWAVDCGLRTVEMSRVKGGPVSLILEGRKVCQSVKKVRQTTWEPCGMSLLSVPVARLSCSLGRGDGK